MEIKNVNNNDFTAFLEGLSTYDSKLSLKDNIDMNTGWMIKEIREMDLSNIDIAVLIQKYKTVILGQNAFDGTIDWVLVHQLYTVIKERLESEVFRRIEEKSFLAESVIDDGVDLSEKNAITFLDYESGDIYGARRCAVSTNQEGSTVERETILFQATAINMNVQCLLKDATYESDKIDHRVAGVDASNIGIVSLITEGGLATIYLPHEISRKQLINLLKECTNRDNYKFRVVHDEKIYGMEEPLSYLTVINFCGTRLAKESKQVTLSK